MGKFVITLRKNGEFQFNLKATNGQVILTSEGYTTKTACLNGIESVKKNAAIPERFEVKEAKNGKPFFNLKASNGQVVGASHVQLGGHPEERHRFRRQERPGRSHRGRTVSCPKV